VHKELLAVSLIGLLVLTWYDGAQYLGVGDFGIRFDREKYLGLLATSWDWSVSFGVSNPTQVAQFFPYGLITLVSAVIKLPLIAVERFWIYWWFTAGGIFFLLLLKELGLSSRGRLFGALLYMMNPYAALVIWHLPHGRIQEPYAYAPLVAYVCIRVLRHGLETKSILLFILMFVLVTSGYSGPNYILIHIFPVVTLILLRLIYVKADLYKKAMTIGRFFVLGLAFLGLSAFWMIPFFLSVDSVLSSSALSAIISNKEAYRMASVSFLHTFRLEGLWSISSSYKGDPYYSWLWLWKTSWYQYALFLIPIVSIYGLIRSARERKIVVLFFSVIFILALFLVKGAQDPLPELNDLFYSLSKFVSAGFRSPYLKFGILMTFGASGLFGLGVESIMSSVNSLRWKNILTAILLAWFALVNAQFINGDVIYRGGKIAKGFRVNLPAEYLDLRTYLSSDSGVGRLIILPLSKTNKTFVNWYNGGYFDKWFSGPHAVVNTDTGGASYTLPSTFAKQVENNSLDAKVYEILLDLMNVRYLLVHKDADWKYIDSHSWYFDHTAIKVDRVIDVLSSRLDRALTNEYVALFQRQRFIDRSFYIPKTIWEYVGVNGNIVDFLRLSNIRADDAFVIGDSNAGMPVVDRRLSIAALTPNQNYPQSSCLRFSMDSSMGGDLMVTPSLENDGMKGELVMGTRNAEFTPEMYSIKSVSGQSSFLYNAELSFLLKSTDRFALINGRVCEKGVACRLTLSGDVGVVTLAGISKERYTPEKTAEKSTIIDASNKDPGSPDFSHGLVYGFRESVFRISSGNHKMAVKLPVQLPPDESSLFKVTYRNTTSHGLQMAYVPSGKRPKSELINLENSAAIKSEYLFVPANVADRGYLYIYLQGKPGDVASADILDIQRFAVSVTGEKTAKLSIRSAPIFGISTKETGSINVEKNMYDELLSEEFNQLDQTAVIDASAAAPGDPGILAQLGEHAEGGTFLDLKTSNHTVGYRLKKTLDSSPQGTYVLRFKYRNIEGQEPFVAIVQRAQSRSIQQRVQLSTSKEWSVNETSFVVRDADVRSIDVYLYSGKNSLSSTGNQFDDLRLLKLRTYPLFYSEQKIPNTDAESYRGSVEFTRKNPALWEVRLNNGHGIIPLVMLESSSALWKMKVGEKHIDGRFVANGYANGWIINMESVCESNPGCTRNADGSWNLAAEVYFEGQRVFVKASLASLCTALILLLAVLARRLVARKKKAV
jgi:hypothetical protein